jgi:type IV secretory pathway VirB10-like protein
MVKRLLALSLIAVPALAVAAGVPSAEDLRRMAQQAENQNRQRAERVSTDDPTSALCAADPKNCKPKTAPAVPTVKKYNNSVPAAPKAAAKKSAPVPVEPEERSIAIQDIPRSSTTAIQQEVLKSNRPRYGIRLGTVINAEIRRNVSSAEAGEIEVWITKDVVGDYLTLPAGTQLFTTMRVNAATKRLDGVTGRAVTPDGEEFDIIARVYDTQMVAGVAGIVNDASDAITNKGVNKGILAAAQGALSRLDRSPAGQAVQQGGSTVLREADRRFEQETNTNIVIYAYPQPILLRVERSF